jgi:hypothetical protein
MSMAARQLFETYRKNNYDSKDELNGRELEWWVKALSHSVRLSGTLTMLDWAFTGGTEPPKEIGPDHVINAHKLVTEYFWPHT